MTPQPETGVPSTEDDTLTLLEDVLGVEPVGELGRVRQFGAGVRNVAVAAQHGMVLLVVHHQRQPGQEAPTVTELALPPDFARYLAAGLVAHARHIQTHPTTQ